MSPREREREGERKILLATTQSECIGKRAKSILLGGRMMASSYLHMYTRPIEGLKTHFLPYSHRLFNLRACLYYAYLPY